MIPPPPPPPPCVDSAETVMTFLGQVGVCVDLTDKDILETFDFFMGDRASDNGVTPEISGGCARNSQAQEFNMASRIKRIF